MNNSDLCKDCDIIVIVKPSYLKFNVFSQFYLLDYVCPLCNYLSCIACNGLPAW